MKESFYDAVVRQSTTLRFRKLAEFLNERDVEYSRIFSDTLDRVKANRAKRTGSSATTTPSQVRFMENAVIDAERASMELAQLLQQVSSEEVLLNVIVTKETQELEIANLFRSSPKEDKEIVNLLTEFKLENLQAIEDYKSQT